MIDGKVPNKIPNAKPNMAEQTEMFLMFAGADDVKSFRELFDGVKVCADAQIIRAAAITMFQSLCALNFLTGPAHNLPLNDNKDIIETCNDCIFSALKDSWPPGVEAI